MTRINALIIDDEQDACKNIEHLLQKHFDQEIAIISSVYSTKQARMQMEKHAIQLFFVDIDMPLESGIEFVHHHADEVKNVIFVTAFDQYAIEAFKLHALDYILKPIDEEAFVKSVQHIIDNNFALSKKEIAQLSKDIQTKNHIDTLTLRDKQQVTIVSLSNILYIEAEKSYSKIVYTDNNEIKTFFASHHLAYYEDLLEHRSFIRVHKSFLVNKTCINKYSFADSFLILKNKFKIPVSRRRQASLLKEL
jgi:two-component system LytT family response regulator